MADKGVSGRGKPAANRSGTDHVLLNPAAQNAGEAATGDPLGEAQAGSDDPLAADEPVEAGEAAGSVASYAAAVGDPLATAAPEDASVDEEAASAPPAVAPAYPSPKVTIAQLKEKIMATVPNNEDMQKATETMNDTMTNAVSEAQSRAKAAYDKSTEAVTEMSDLAKGNVEAVVESTKILASGMQELGRTYADEAKSAYEQMTADLKEMAAIKSPTELFQLQTKIMRRNFDMLVATSSKSTEAVMKLANEAFAPLSGRMNAAAEKISKVS